MGRRPAGRDTAAAGPAYIGHGIAEWYGALFRNLPEDERRDRLENPTANGIRWPCRFTESFPAAAPRRGTQPNLLCTKKGGVCSLRGFFTDPAQGGVIAGFGAIACTCPMRFVENGTAFTEIARVVLGVDGFRYVKEVGFLQRVSRDPLFPEAGIGTVPAIAPEQSVADIATGEGEGPAAQEDPENVGRIDTLLVDPDDTRNWCAVELQAVYFSGPAMATDFAAIRSQGAGENNLPMPARNRRADFRSSGPKRLLPQLQIKVPSLRRWGKKMVVVVDAPFFNSLGPMEEVGDISNADIVWCVVDYHEDSGSTEAQLYVRGMVNTTLESAIVGLTAGRPVTKPTFEARIAEKLRRG